MITSVSLYNKEIPELRAADFPQLQLAPQL